MICDVPKLYLFIDYFFSYWFYKLLTYSVFGSISETHISGKGMWLLPVVTWDGEKRGPSEHRVIIVRNQTEQHGRILFLKRK